MSRPGKLVSTPEKYSYQHRLPLNRVESQWPYCIDFLIDDTFEPWNTGTNIARDALRGAYLYPDTLVDADSDKFGHAITAVPPG